MLTHRAREDDVREGSTFTFVTDGFDAALDWAAASDKDVMLHSGTAIQQGLRAGVLDELQLLVVPVLLGARPPAAGELRWPADQYVPVRVLEGANVTHLRYRVLR